MRPVRSSEHYRRQGSSPSSLAAAAAGAAGRASPLFRNSSSFHPTRSHQNLARPQPMPRNPPPRGVRGGAFEEEVRDRAGGVVVSESHGGAGGMVGHGGAAPLGGNLVPDGGSSGSLRGSPVMMHSPSPLRAASPSFSPGSYMSHPPLASGMGGGGGRQCKSPYGFIPIPRHGDDQPPAQHRGGGGPPPPSHRFTPPLSSPLSYRKSICSPSMFSTISNDDTEDTASLTLDASISSRLGSPYPVGGYGSRTGTPLLGRSSPRPWTPTALGAGGGGRQSPFPDDDSTTLVRKTRIKTEMCMHYVNHRPCPFGATCTYAHGEEELQMTRLLDLERAGLVDLETYRTKPCLAWVMTGSCPFGSRCTGIHDPRVKGTSPSWLTHTETQGNTLASDINVESLHQKRFHEVHEGTPFGHRFSLRHDRWGDLYKLVCNLRYAKGGWIDTTPHHHHTHAPRQPLHTDHNSRRRQQRSRRRSPPPNNAPVPLDPAHKLQIALLMRGSDPDWCYKFRPQHLINDEMCMVLQHRAFRIEPAGVGGNGDDTDAYDVVVEVPLPEASAGQPRGRHPDRTGIVEVRELAFGPDSDASVRGVALYFHIDPSKVSECTAAQAKRYRWKRPPTPTSTAGPNGSPNGPPSGDRPAAERSGATASSAFDHLDSFEMIRPHDHAAYELATDILRHRLAVLRAEGIASMRERFERLQVLERDKSDLQRRFEGLRRHWTLWGWPINAGRDKVDKNTPVPRVDGRYEFPRQRSADYCDDDDLGELDSDQVLQAETGADSRRIWNSFVTTCFDTEPLEGMAACLNPSKRRLVVFQHLAEGREIAADRSLPLLLDPNAYRTLKQNESVITGYCENEKCWRALLLEPEREGCLNEWTIVRDHFENSRSNKVLSIIQSKSSTSGPPGL